MAVCDGREYLFDSNEKRAWHDAEEHCVLVGGHLAMPETDAQTACIQTLIGSASAWIGLWSSADTSCSRATFSSGTFNLQGWVWVDGVARAYDKWLRNPGADPPVVEPDCVLQHDGSVYGTYSSTDGQGAYLIGSTGLWADGSLNDRLPYVCARGALGFPDPRRTSHYSKLSCRVAFVCSDHTSSDERTDRAAIAGTERQPVALAYVDAHDVGAFLLALAIADQFTHDTGSHTSSHDGYPFLLALA